NMKSKIRRPRGGGDPVNAQSGFPIKLAMTALMNRINIFATPAKAEIQSCAIWITAFAVMTVSWLLIVERIGASSMR
ncbi:MAG: hypothetical protein JXX14_08930, partial [Deltaproteobacteria bacterium]|nr:hypothetical protein [Deltaproteobacteria bacterium]